MNKMKSKAIIVTDTDNVMKTDIGKICTIEGYFVINHYVGVIINIDGVLFKSSLSGLRILGFWEYLKIKLYRARVGWRVRLKSKNPAE